jgi:hypothetical protein
MCSFGGPDGLAAKSAVPADASYYLDFHMGRSKELKLLADIRNPVCSEKPGF